MIDTRLRATVALAALVTALAPAAWAQNLGGANVNFDVDEDVSDVVEDIRDDVDDDFDRDIDRFGNEGRELGFQGSVALRATSTSGNNEATDVGLGASFEYFDGLNGSDLNFAYVYSNDDDSDEAEQDIYLSTTYTRELGREFYGFAKGVATYDDTEIDPGDDDVGDDDVDEAAFQSDIFVGVGLGFRIANSEQLQWSVQAGPGYRWYEPYGDEDRVEEVAVSATSNFLYQFTPTVFVTNDTDVIASEENTSILNDLALNVALNESLSLRTSLLTEYQSDPGTNVNNGEEFENTDNTLGVAVVYSF